MKNSAIIFAAFAGWALLSGCSKQIYSHEQVMVSYHTKDDVIKQFGQPDEIMVVNDTTQWLYNCSDPSVFNDTKTKVKINGVYNAGSGFNTVPVSVKQFSQHNRYVKFTFNTNGNILNWNSSGVNFAERKAKPLATIGILVGAIVVVISTIGLIALANWHM